MNEVKINCKCGHIKELHRETVPVSGRIVCDFFLGYYEEQLYHAIYCNCSGFISDNLKYLEELSVE